jgi:uncharacterized protein HemX
MVDILLSGVDPVSLALIGTAIAGQGVSFAQGRRQEKKQEKQQKELEEDQQNLQAQEANAEQNAAAQSANTNALRKLQNKQGGRQGTILTDLFSAGNIAGSQNKTLLGQ